MLLFWFLSTAVREDCSAFCFPSYGHSKKRQDSCAYSGNFRYAKECCEC